MTPISLPNSIEVGQQKDPNKVQENDEALRDQANSEIATINAKFPVGTADLGANTVTVDKLATTVQEALGLNSSTITRSDYDEVLTEQTTNNPVSTDLATVGPTCTVVVPTNGYVAIAAEVELKNNGAGFSFVTLTEPTDIPASIFITSSSSSFIKKYSQPDNDTNGAGTKVLAGLLVFPATAGTRAYKLQYRTDGAGGGLGSFKNRKLWCRAFSRPA